MENSYTLLADLKAGICFNAVEVRLLRFWEARNVRKGGELKSVDLLFVDENLLDLANTGKQLPDVIGEVNAIRSTITNLIAGSQCVMLTLRLHSGENVCIRMFDSMAVAFHSKFDGYEKEPKIILVTSVNPKIVGGRLFMNATFGTHLYFDSETAVGKEVYNTLVGEGSSQSSSSSKIVHAQKIEPLTVSELNHFINTADSQIIEFLCTAKITGIQQEDGWSYIGCSKCSKKLVREVSSFTCVSHNETNVVATLIANIIYIRYRVTLSVSDHTDTASFLGFDMEMAKLTNIQASKAAQIVVRHEVNH
ncbi:unnamed protein product [Eruca vesicaria subsp. sativa]|uniref:Replication factor A C-terminal domain-containing protein n=1 Tax=Eruca vesicaria subsp. sativa TaxID=29727 RepID=A0ABC8IY36_ERUVS|nr:unnamed protein product [Eruca vesicaria subsp. sativa]